MGAYKPKRVPKPKSWIADLKLFESDKKLLLDPVGWLNDSIVNAAQEVLKKQFPALGSLQDVALGVCMNFKIQAGDFIQILHSNYHWLTIGLQYPVFDSLYTSISTTVKAQIANLMSTQNTKIGVNIMDVQTQVYISSLKCMHICVASYKLYNS